MIRRQASQTPRGDSPSRSSLVLLTLILAAGVANLNLSVANVALPTIGAALDASQAGLNLVAIGFSLGLAGSVLYLGAIGDRHGRKKLLILGLSLSMPASILAAFAPNVEVLFLARFIGGVAAGMAYPTTLALITALWSGARRVNAIAAWSGIGGAIAALGPLAAGWLLRSYSWGSVFLVTIPIAAIALVLVILTIPAHVKEGTQRVDHLGGVLSVFFVSALVLSINLAASPGGGTAAIILASIALICGVVFFLRERQTSNPIYDFRVAGRPTFWVAAVGGIVVFGSLMGAMFIGQQFVQNVLGYSALEAGLAILPAAFFMIVAAPLAGRLVVRVGSRIVIVLGCLSCLVGFVVMLVLWDINTSYWEVGLGYCLIGLGVGFAGPPSSRSLTSSVPIARVGMASGTADLQRDFGGAIMQSILGALLTAGYGAAMASTIASAPPQVHAEITSGIQAQLQKSFDGAKTIAEQYPTYSQAILDAAKESFLSGANWAYATGIVAMLVGIGIAFFFYPKHAKEVQLLASYSDTKAAPPRQKK